MGHDEKPVCPETTPDVRKLPALSAQADRKAAERAANERFGEKLGDMLPAELFKKTAPKVGHVPKP